MSERRAAGRKRTNDPDGMRRRVLDVAAEAFQARGYHATSMHEILSAAGMTGGALYHHFPTKKDLGLAVIRERVAREVNTTWIEPVQSARAASEGIFEVFDAIIASLDERGAVQGCPLGNLALELSLADPDFRAAVREVFETWRRALAERLRTERRAGKGETDPEALATLIVASYSGAMAMAKAEQSSEPLKVCADELARVLGPRTRKGQEHARGAASSR
ncbi:TetR family transcriptional regulator C-terminal domain-containing protein [Pendulispora albinea]|uniref:TetR/AcrR family transcriptional regulator n=1 Tax=Pendulispora albinea TaxID=2741071 RepID=A0ABZ2LY88_9BACT